MCVGHSFQSQRAKNGWKGLTVGLSATSDGSVCGGQLLGYTLPFAIYRGLKE